MAINCTSLMQVMWHGSFMNQYHSWALMPTRHSSVLLGLLGIHLFILAAKRFFKLILPVRTWLVWTSQKRGGRKYCCRPNTTNIFCYLCRIHSKLCSCLRYEYKYSHQDQQKQSSDLTLLKNSISHTTSLPRQWSTKVYYQEWSLTYTSSSSHLNQQHYFTSPSRSA